MTRPIPNDRLERIFKPRPEPEAHHAAMAQLSERMARDWNKVFDTLEGREG